MINPTNGVQWRRANDCTGSNCLEVAKDGELYLVRDSKNPDGAPIRLTEAEWQAFVAGVKAGDFSF